MSIEQTHVARFTRTAERSRDREPADGQANEKPWINA
jgi:hypothetical protein